jgi:hypothetical protein
METRDLETPAAAATSLIVGLFIILSAPRGIGVKDFVLVQNGLTQEYQLYN